MIGWCDVRGWALVALAARKAAPGQGCAAPKRAVLCLQLRAGWAMRVLPRYPPSSHVLCKGGCGHLCAYVLANVTCCSPACYFRPM